MSINLLKRLESSVNSFRLTLERIKSLISSTIDKLATIEQGENFELELEDISQNLDYDDREADMFIGGKKTKIALQDLDHIAWRRYLEEDMENLNLLLLMLADITPEHDSKLQQLIADLRHKFANPINDGNKRLSSLQPLVIQQNTFTTAWLNQSRQNTDCIQPSYRVI